MKTKKKHIVRSSWRRKVSQNSTI